MPCVQAHNLAVKSGFDEALISNGEHVTECSFANIFFVKNNSLITPGRNILYGVTRDKIIDLATHAGVDVIERDVRVSEIGQMDGAFITKTSAGVLSVAKIDEMIYKKNPITMRMKKSYENLLKNTYEK